MAFSNIYEGARARLGYGQSYRYQELESLHGALDVIRTKGSHFRHRIIAGTFGSILLLFIYFLISPGISLSSSLGQDSLYEWWNTGDATTQPHYDSCESMPERIQVTILETLGTHDEVDAALVHAFGSQPDTNVDLYQSEPRFDIGSIIGAFSLNSNLTGPTHPNEFMKEGRETLKPDVLVLTTCELSMFHAKGRLANLLEQGGTRLVCVVHHSEVWAYPENEAGIRAWVDKGMVEFWTLSPHTADFLENVIGKWSGSPSVQIRVFVPVFPVTPPADSTSSERELGFALQGDYDPHRRDYKHIFERLGTFLHDHNSGERNVSLHLLGRGDRPSVPEDVRDHVFFDQGLSYPEFYGVLSHVSALLSGFASPDYLDRKASSSVPAALIAGTPLVATQALLDAYSYMDADSVWLQDEGETDFDVVSRIVDASHAERTAKKMNARARCAHVIHNNTLNVGQWIHEAVYDMRCESADVR